MSFRKIENYSGYMHRKVKKREEVCVCGGGEYKMKDLKTEKKERKKKM